MITGYNDTFNRTVANGFGTSTSGHAYTVVTNPAQYSVTPSVASIVPNALAEWYGFTDRQTSDIDITGQVALSAIPATNLMTVGFLAKRDLAGANYYNATMMVAAGGAISLRFSKVVSGGLSTIATVATGLTYVANTVYNLRAAIYWSNALQANVLQSKLWLTTATEPGGWMATATDGSHTQYTAGTQVGLLTRNEAAVPTGITARFQNVAARSYGLPIPAGVDPMCLDPAVAYPRQTGLESLADAADLVMAGFDPLADLAQFFPRVRVSNSNFVINTASNVTGTWTTTEFNVGTGTNLGYDGQGLYLPYGIWLATMEVQMNPAASDFIQLNITGGAGPAEYAYTLMRSNALQSNLDGQGGSGHVSTLIYSNNPGLNARVTAAYNPNTATPYTVRYAAFSAIKISDYF